MGSINLVLGTWLKRTTKIKDQARYFWFLILFGGYSPPFCLRRPSSKKIRHNTMYYIGMPSRAMVRETGGLWPKRRAQNPIGSSASTIVLAAVLLAGVMSGGGNAIGPLTPRDPPALLLLLLLCFVLFSSFIMRGASISSLP